MTKPLSRKSFAAAGAATLASINVLRQPASAAQFQYKYASNLTIDHPLNVRMIQMWNAVKQETNGVLDVAVFPNSQLGGDTAMLTQLRSGALQFFTLDGGVLQSIVPVSAISGVGFAFKNSAQAFSAFDGALGEYVRKEIVAKSGLVVFPKIWQNGMRQVTSSTHPIRTADDLSNFKIRTPAGALWVDLFRSLGASPTPINFSETYTALQNHTVDGEENPFAVIASARLFEVQKYLSVTNHMWSAWWLLGNPDAYKALPANVQAIVERNAAKYALLQRADTELRNNSLADKLERSGMTLNIAETSGFRARLGDFYKRWHATFGDAAWNLLEQTTGKLG